ncbi:MAG: DUF1292 domain-containing protein [Lachnospiraceae bacterium]|nr:DUF1292 domain-containing protein [Lachnospiraceae bacterium]
MAKANNPVEDEEIYMDVETDEGTVTCSIIAIFSKMGKDYIALLPLDEKEENKDGEVWLYGYEEDSKGNSTLINLVDDEEYEIASDAFDEYLDAQEFDELVGEDDEEE